MSFEDDQLRQLWSVAGLEFDHCRNVVTDPCLQIFSNDEEHCMVSATLMFG